MLKKREEGLDTVGCIQMVDVILSRNKASNCPCAPWTRGIFTRTVLDSLMYSNEETGEL